MSDLTNYDDYLSDLEELPDAFKTLPPKHLKFLVAYMETGDRAKAASAAGYTARSKSPAVARQQLNKTGYWLLERLEQQGLMRQWLTFQGLDDITLAGKMTELMTCGVKTVELSALQLIMRLKGHMAEQEEKQQATEIHLHVMQAGQPNDKSVAKPVLDMTKLLDKDAS